MIALTTLSGLRHPIDMKRGRAWVVGLMLASQPLCAVAASYHSDPNPIGEQIYSTHSLSRVVPIVIVIVGFSLAWALNRARQKARKPASNPTESHR
jgi:hypothetical protein